MILRVLSNLKELTSLTIVWIKDGCQNYMFIESYRCKGNKTHTQTQ